MQRAACGVPTSHAVSTVGRGDASTLFVSPSVGLSVGLSVGRSCCVSVVKATVRRRLAVGHSLVWVVGLAVKTSKDTDLRARKVGWFVPCQRYHPEAWGNVPSGLEGPSGEVERLPSFYPSALSPYNF